MFNLMKELLKFNNNVKGFISKWKVIFSSKDKMKIIINIIDNDTDNINILEYDVMSVIHNNRIDEFKDNFFNKFLLRSKLIDSLNSLKIYKNLALFNQSIVTFIDNFKFAESFLLIFFGPSVDDILLNRKIIMKEYDSYFNI